MYIKKGSLLPQQSQWARDRSEKQRKPSPRVDTSFKKQISHQCKYIQMSNTMIEEMKDKIHFLRKDLFQMRAIKRFIFTVALIKLPG